MPGLITGRELMERWGISAHEFLHRFVKQGLIAYNADGQEVSPEEVFHGIEDPREGADKIIDWHRLEMPGSDEVAQQMLDKIGDLYFDEGNAQGMEEAFHLAGGEKAEQPDKPKKPRKLRPDQRHRLACREEAKKLWAVHPEMTIEDMRRRDELNAVCEGRVYTREPMRKWIKDLAPNRKPGRPKKKSD